MTRLTYIVGDREIISYEEAREISKRSGFPVIPKYQPISEITEIDYKRLEKIKKREGGHKNDSSYLRF